KNADAVRKISFARRNSRTSRSSSVIRVCSAVVVPGRSPASTSAWVTQLRRVSGLIPSWSATRRSAPVLVAGSRLRSTAIRIARSRSSSGYFLGAAMTLILPWNESLHQTRGATVLAQDRFGSGSEPRIRMLRLRGDGRVARSERWCGAVIASLLPVAGCSTVRRKNLGGQLGGIRHRARRGRLWRDVPERCGGSRVPRRRTGTIASAWKGGCAAGATRRHVVLALRDR